MSRATISDIARACGVSPTAVSFALNGRPGVSEARRAEIMATARAMGWTPSAAARAPLRVEEGLAGRRRGRRYGTLSGAACEHSHERVALRKTSPTAKEKRTLTGRKSLFH